MLRCAAIPNPAFSKLLSQPCLCSLQELCQKIIKGVYNTPTHISAEAKDLLARMLTVVPDHRITFEQVRGFPNHFVSMKH